MLNVNIRTDGIPTETLAKALEAIAAELRKDKEEPNYRDVPLLDRAGYPAGTWRFTRKEPGVER